MRSGILHLAVGTALAIALSASSAYAQKKYDPGASDTEIKFGQTVPFSGPYSAYANIGKTEAAYMNMINAQGGINGRKLNLIQSGMSINTSPTDYRVNKQMQMMKFNGERWELFGPIIEDTGPAG